MDLGQGCMGGVGQVHLRDSQRNKHWSGDHLLTAFSALVCHFLWASSWSSLSDDKLYMRMCVCMRWSRSVMSDSLQIHGLYPTRLLSPWDFPGKNTEVGCHFLLQGIFLTQGSNPGLPRCRQTLYCLSYQGSYLHINITIYIVTFLDNISMRNYCSLHPSPFPCETGILWNPKDFTSGWPIIHEAGGFSCSFLTLFPFLLIHSLFSPLSSSGLQHYLFFPRISAEFSEPSFSA